MPGARGRATPLSRPPVHAAIVGEGVRSAGGRDDALDIIRGLAVALAVLNHLPTASAYQWFTVERLGFVTGAELLVLVSGLVLGMVHRRRIAEYGWRASAWGLWRRSFQLYRVTVAIVVTIWVVGAAGVRLDVLRAWTDPVTGTVYPMIPAPGLAGLWDVLRLRAAPWQSNVLGLYVVLTALAPLALWLLQRGRWPLLLAASWAAYAANAWLRLRVTGAAFEGPFPLLTWQLPFALALAVGYHRHDLALAWPDARRWSVPVATILAAALALFAWNNPWTGAPAPTRLALLPPDRFAAVYGVLAGERTWLRLGRLADAGLVVYVLHAALTRWRAGVARPVGLVLAPLGRASLYVFVLHLGVVAVVARTAGAGAHALLRNTLLHTAALVVLWACVRGRVLFRWIPR